MVDKSLETDRDLTLEFELDVPNNNFEIGTIDGNKNIMDDLIEQKRAADTADKVKPKVTFLITNEINYVIILFSIF